MSDRFRLSSASTTVYYYVEANAVKTHGTTVFSPARAEQGASHYRVGAPVAKESPRRH